MQEKLSLSESQLQGCDARKQEILAELNDSKNAVRSQDNLRRSIEDNLNYRKIKAEVEELTREIESLEERILKIGGFSSFEAELAKLLQERERLLSEVCMKNNISFFETDILCPCWCTFLFLFAILFLSLVNPQVCHNKTLYC